VPSRSPDKPATAEIHAPVSWPPNGTSSGRPLDQRNPSRGAGLTGSARKTPGTTAQETTATERHRRLPTRARRPLTIRVKPGRPVTMVLAVAHCEPLVITDPASAWSLLEQDGRR
jgi:hypothetical protein